tara:strand:- start:8026 stop:8187 length:162 start_codon:yes stop_codon:yes gene_type:complete
MNEDYWDAQLEAFEKQFKKPVWRDYLSTQRVLMDNLHSVFWNDITKKHKKDGK